MVDISLKSYNDEIKSLIKNGQIDEAIAHCQHILKIYPKYVDTYRLLGEAYLEEQRYLDAADVFQRVLSTIPDDFESHVGMSILREEEESYDEAIWHMERAFEIQPSNNQIQNELNRLYKYRDGIEPSKVRLNRSALARMYIKGNLLPQAIAEIRAALDDDPNRLDLKLLLAEVLMQTNQTEEAADYAQKVLADLPYCMTANRIMSEYLRQIGRIEDAQQFNLRLSEINPYASFLSEEYATIDEVPEISVKVEKLSLIPADSAAPLIISEAEQVTDESLEEKQPSLVDVAIATMVAEELLEQPDDSKSLVTDQETSSEELIQPVQPSEWLQEIDEPDIKEEDTKPIPLETAAAISAVDIDSSREAHPDAQAVIGEPTEEMPPLPDWLQELADDMESTSAIEQSQQADIVITNEVEAETVIETGITPQDEEKPLQPPSASAEMDKLTAIAFADLGKDAPKPFELARQNLANGNVDEAMRQYNQLIKTRDNLPMVISDLQQAAKHFPKSVLIWQNLGDAYLRNHQMKEAISAYSEMETVEDSA